jgi:hypothetical protein
MLTEYFFWFAQPSSALNVYDRVLGYFFAGLVILGIVVWLVKKFAVRHPVVKNLLDRYVSAVIWIGIFGLIWFGFRYEAVPIFSKRMFAGLVILIGLVWLGFIKWYFVSKFFKDKREYDYGQVRNKYIPGNK